MHPTNFRDVGDALGLWLEPSPLVSGRLFRGGRFDALSTLADLGDARTILNLRRGVDSDHLGARLVHVPAPDDLENYDTSSRRVVQWVSSALSVLAGPEVIWPVYIHCTSGRDRTGVVVAALLSALGVPRATIVDEYLLSSGAAAPLIERALDGLVAVRVREGEVRRLRAALRAT